MNITICIPTYFGGPLLLGCINSILKNVSNPKINVFKNDIGWLKACNEMMQNTKGDVILLNDDTVVLSDIVEQMSQIAYSDPKIGIVGGKALAPDQQTVINYGIYVGTDGNTAHKYYGKNTDEVLGIELQKAVEGSCMYIKRELLDKIGFFDENYGMGYREEVDLCFRAREAGYKIMSTSSARYVHFVSQTNSQLDIKNETYDYFMSKWGTKLKLGKV